MNYTAKDLIQKFSTKKDALQAVQLWIKLLDTLNENSSAQFNSLLKEIENYQDKDLAVEVLDLFNQVNGTQYRNDEKIRAIIRNQPKATFDQFASIIYHKKETWGNDPKMKEYLRPATLFGSVNKFKTYLDDATNYWIKKAKANG